MTEFEKQYTPEAAAQIAGVTRRTFYSYMKNGRIRAHKVGGRWRITHSDLTAFLYGPEDGEQRDTGHQSEG